MIDRSNPPEGFEPVLWSEVTHGDIVHLQGTKDGQPHAYGPHIVRSTANRMLENPKLGRHFTHLPEELLRMIVMDNRLTQVERCFPCPRCKAQPEQKCQENGAECDYPHRERTKLASYFDVIEIVS